MTDNRSDRYLMARRMVDMYQHDETERTKWQEIARKIALCLEPVVFPEPRSNRMPIGRIRDRAPDWMCQ